MNSSLLKAMMLGRRSFPCQGLRLLNFGGGTFFFNDWNIPHFEEEIYRLNLGPAIPFPAKLDDLGGSFSEFPF